MNQQLEQQVTKVVRNNWDSLCHQILDRFTTTTKADLDAATSADDLIHRITASSSFTPDYVEAQVAELVGAGAPIQASQGQSIQQPTMQGQSRRGRGKQQQFQGQQFQGQPQRSFGSYSKGLIY